MLILHESVLYSHLVRSAPIEDQDEQNVVHQKNKMDSFAAFKGNSKTTSAKPNRVHRSAFNASMAANVIQSSTESKNLTQEMDSNEDKAAQDVKLYRLVQRLLKESPLIDG